MKFLARGQGAGLSLSQLCHKLCGLRAPMPIGKPLALYDFPNSRFCDQFCGNPDLTRLSLPGTRSQLA